jgi:phospholipase C
MRRPAFIILAISALSFAGCASRFSSASPDLVHSFLPARAAASSPTPSSGSGPIKHVVIMVQENRSFDNFFAGYPGADAPMYGYMRTTAGQRRKVPLRELTLRHEPGGLPHGYGAGYADFDDGNMDGFNRSAAASAQPPNSPYAYIDRQDVAPLWAIAKRYVLADHMFPTEFGDSFTAHINLIASTTALDADTAEANEPNSKPWGCDAPPGTNTTLVNDQHVVTPMAGPFPCFTQFHTIADSLDAANVSWRYYAPSVHNSGWAIWSEFDAIQAVRYGNDWKNVVTPETTIFADIKNQTLASVSWVIPDFNFSDHPGAQSDKGPSWIAAVVNAIGKSSYWDSTAIVVVWDDWGGWYDNLAPPQLDFRGLGIRVPCLIVSSYARKNYVSHTQYEFGSILHFVEQTYNLPFLGSLSPSFGNGYTDARSSSIADSFDFTQKPRPFFKIPAPYPAAYFMNVDPSFKPPDDY